MPAFITVSPLGAPFFEANIDWGTSDWFLLPIWIWLRYPFVGFVLILGVELCIPIVGGIYALIFKLGLLELDIAEDTDVGCFEKLTILDGPWPLYPACVVNNYWDLDDIENDIFGAPIFYEGPLICIFCMLADWQKDCVVNIVLEINFL